MTPPPGPTATLDPPEAGAPPIDPRIRARRIEVRRVEGRRRLQRLVDLGAVAVVALGFVAALWTPLLDVDQVRVEGAVHTGATRVLERAGVRVGDRLASVDLRATGERIAALPWVQQVRIHRGIGGVVTIDVTERTAVAALGTGPGALLVDRDGRVLGPASEAPAGEPVVTLAGVDAAVAPGAFVGPEAGDALVLAERLRAAVPGTFVALRPDGLTGTLAQGGEVRFGDTAQLDAKVRSLRTVLAQVDLSCLGVLDLQLPGSPVLTREERCS